MKKIKCIACKGSHKFESCKVASPEHLNMKMELARARAVANFNNISARFGVSARAEIYGNQIKISRNLTEKVRNI